MNKLFFAFGLVSVGVIGVVVGYQYGQSKSVETILKTESKYLSIQKQHGQQIANLQKKLTAAIEDAAYIVSSARIPSSDAKLPFCSPLLNDKIVDQLTLDYKGTVSTMKVINIDDDTRITVWEGSVDYVLRGGEGPYLYPISLTDYFAKNAQKRSVMGIVDGYYNESYYPFGEPNQYMISVMTKPWVLPRTPKTSIIEIWMHNTSQDNYKENPIRTKSRTKTTLDTVIDSLTPLPCK
jgi:hypothetical protein